MRRRLALLLLPLLLVGLALVGANTTRTFGDWLPFEPDATVLADCVELDAIENLPCLRQAYANIAWRDGAETAMRELWVDESRHGQTIVWCHRIAHLVGEAVWSRSGGELATAIPEISADFESEPAARAYFLRAGDCVDGLFHGLLEREFADRPNPADAIDELAALCGDSALWADDTNVSALRCVHGIGHGAMIVSENRLADALALCDRTALVKEEWPGLCGSGVFMEYAAPTVAGGSLVDPADPFADCLELDAPYDAQCYLHAARVVIEEIEGAPGLAALCAPIEPITGRSACSFEVGSALFERTVGLAPEAFPSLVSETCALFSPFLVSCLNGALEDASHDPDPLLAVARACESFPEAFRYPCGIVAEVRRDWREISTSDCSAIADRRVRAGCEWSERAAFAPQGARDPELTVE